jgi:hypothetical protein
LEEDISDIDTPVEIEENNKDILDEEDILDVNAPAEIKEDDEKKNMEI